MLEELENAREAPKLAVFGSEAPRCAKEVVALWESSELAGRTARKAERANTIMTEWRMCWLYQVEKTT